MAVIKRRKTMPNYIPRYFSFKMVEAVILIFQHFINIFMLAKNKILSLKLRYLYFKKSSPGNRVTVSYHYCGTHPMRELEFYSTSQIIYMSSWFLVHNIYITRIFVLFSIRNVPACEENVVGVVKIINNRDS